MAKFKTDTRDIFFNLFEIHQAEQFAEGYEADDLKDIVHQFDKFIENEVYPTRQEGDEIGVKFNDKGDVVVPESFKKANEQFYANGWYGLGYPEDIGGMPAPHTVSLACSSILTGANVAFSMYQGLTKGAMNVILAVGSDEQKAKYITPMMEGRFGGTMCLTEPGAGSDVGASSTTAKPNDDGSYDIKGVKIFISSGDNDLYENIIHLVLARTPDAPEGVKGLSLFIVPKTLDDGTANDVKCTKLEEKMGIHGSATCELTFGQDSASKGWLIGKEFHGIINMFLMMNEARLMCGMQGESQANLAYELTLQYAKERSQFGTPLVNLPDVKRMLVKMRAVSRGMRALNFYTANLFDKSHAGQKEVEAEIALLTPICKGYCSDEGFQVAVDAIQVHGGYGFCTEYGIEQFARDTKIATIYEGTNGIQAIDFVTRKILKDKGAAFLAAAGKISETLKDEESKKWAEERRMMVQSMKEGEEMMAKLQKLAMSGNTNGLLAFSTDFMSFCGNLFVGWLLLDQALKAEKALAGAEGADKDYYQSKILDYRIFCQHYLSRNAGIARSVLGFEEDLTSVVL